MDPVYHSLEQDAPAVVEENHVSQRSFELEHLFTSTLVLEPLFMGFERASSGNVSPVSEITRSGIAQSFHGDEHGDAPRMASDRQILADEELQSEASKHLDGLSIALLYCPFILRKSVLLIFAFICLVMIVVLGILYAISQHNDGLGSPSEKLHLLWKYGPTTILVLVSALWGQVELRTKQLMPWEIMQSKAADAEETVLLDYVDQTSIFALFTSLKASHWPVFLAITGGMMLKLAIIFSSALLNLDTVHVQEASKNMVADYQFDAKNYSLGSIDGTAYSYWYAIQKFNLSYPVGTTPTQAYQFFNLSSPPESFDLSGLSMNGVAEQFSAQMTCQPLLDRLTYSYTFEQGQNFIPYNGAQVNLTSPQLGYYMLDIVSPPCNASLQVETQYAGSMYLVNCSTGQTTISWDGLAQLQTRNSSQDQVIFAFRGLVQNQTQLTAVLCKPSYNLGNSQISLPYSESITPPGLGSAKNGQFPNLSALDVLDAFRVSVERQPSDLFQSFQNAPVGDYFFSVLNVTNYHSHTWLDPESLSQNISNIYSGFTAQLARHSFTTASNSSIQGTIAGDSNRLVVQTLSMALIVATLVISMFILIALVFVAPRGKTPQDPSTIGGLASILARSPDFIQLILGNGQLGHSSSSLDHLKHSRYRTDIDFNVENPQFKICAFEVGEKGPNKLRQSSEANIKWWKPYSMTTLNKVLISVFLSTLIAILEILYRLSQRRDGLASVPENDYVKLSWSYVPVTVVVILGMLLEGYDFTLRVLQPYLALRRGNTPAAISVLDTQLNRIAFSRLWSAMSTFQLTAMASTAAVLLVHVLTIAISGLYVARLKPQMIPNITASQLDLLDGSQLDNSFRIPSDWNDGWADDINRQSLPGLVLDYNMPKPQWTTSDFTLPRIKVSANQTTGLTNSSSNGQTLQLIVSAIRGNLNCSLLPDSKVALMGLGIAESSYTTYGQPMPDVKGLVIQTPALEQCGDAGFNYTATQYSFASGYVGQVRYGSTNEALMSSVNTTCPQFVMVFGYIDPTITNNITNANVSIAWCNPFYERLDVNISYLLPNYKVQSAIADENTAAVQTLPNIWPVAVQSFSDLPTSKSNGAGSSMYPFFQSLLISDPDLLPLSSIGRKDKVSDVLSSMATKYRTLSAQTANIYLRSAPLIPPPSLPGSLTDNARLRLVQSAIPTRILQAVLAVILICIIVLYIANWNSGRVLPASPTNIASVTSLLAGARLLDFIPEGAEWSSNKELKEMEVFGRNGGFSLRWWGEDESNNGVRFGIDKEGLRNN